MIKVVAKAVYMEEKIDIVKDLFSNLIEETKKEKGCISYDLYQEVNNKAILTMIEEWESLENLDNHSNSEHYTRIIPEIRSYRVSTDINVYEKVSL